MIDQMIRTESGGAYEGLIRDLPEEELHFAEARLGRSILDAYRGRNAYSPERRRLSVGQRLRTILKKWLNSCLGINIDQARFRASGEIHQWMYDEFNLAELLRSCGFTDCATQSATQSNISKWTNYSLDTDSEGLVRKPDSLFMEARKPSP